MKRPTDKLLRALAKALEEAEHPNVAGAMLAGTLWAMYPKWYDETLRDKQLGVQK